MAAAVVGRRTSRTRTAAASDSRQQAVIGHWVVGCRAAAFATSTSGLGCLLSRGCTCDNAIAGSHRNHSATPTRQVCAMFRTQTQKADSNHLAKRKI